MNEIKLTDRQLRILMRFYMKTKGYADSYIPVLIKECFEAEAPPDSALQRSNT